MRAEVTIDLGNIDAKRCCPKCSETCLRSATASKRTWLHRNTIQFITAC
ncbi:hypothetical protein RBSWK_06052 [Rhodopirellula baltica SWK14]|uniref:Uncharacterized protein n=1 Tax=Rhodopirellula baltica SWK14 TaxID=993516 RepID=L7C709_RHOBT|nr:hypothetical protein RBSWK_06052 [Rhodopirellula baltica SWK14]